MNPRLRRLVLLTCALVATIQAHAVMQRDPRTSPKSIRIIVDGSGKITPDNGGAGVPRDRVWAQAGGNVAFVIENRDSVPHRVRIPIKEFKPSRIFNDATPDPLLPNQKDEVDVAPRSVEVIIFRVKDATALQFKDRPALTYKYNIHTKPSGRTEIHLDPDIEIDKPQ